MATGWEFVNDAMHATHEAPEQHENHIFRDVDSLSDQEADDYHRPERLPITPDASRPATPADAPPADDWQSPLRRRPAVHTDDYPTRTCVVCGEDFVESLLEGSVAPCDHGYCRNCLDELINAALTDESLFPPKCCQQAIPLYYGKHLTTDQFDLFKEKEREYSTTNRTYCHNSECNKFLWSETGDDKVLTCPVCDTKTCVACKGADHDNADDCPGDASDQAIMELLKQEKWQRCYQCKAIVELDHGCNHMTCRCGAEFCYECGTQWKNCECQQWQEARLLARDREAEEDAIVWAQWGDEPAAADGLALWPQREVEPPPRAFVWGAMPAHEVEPPAVEECLHAQGWRQQQVQGAECERCHTVMPRFIYACRECNAWLCRRCRRGQV